MVEKEDNMSEEEEETKIVEVVYSAQFRDSIEVPKSWKWDGSLDQLMEHTDLPYGNGTGDLLDYEVRDNA